MFNLTKFTSALNDMGVKVLIPFDDFSVWLFKGKYDITLTNYRITSNSKRWSRRNKRKKTDIEN